LIASNLLKNILNLLSPAPDWHYGIWLIQLSHTLHSWCGTSIKESEMLDVAFVSAFLTVLVIVPILRRRREAKKR